MAALTIKVLGETCSSLFRVCAHRAREWNVLICLLFQGTNASALEKEIGPEQFPVNEHYFGLVNVSQSFPSTIATLGWSMQVCSVDISSGTATLIASGNCTWPMGRADWRKYLFHSLWSKVTNTFLLFVFSLVLFLFVWLWNFGPQLSLGTPVTVTQYCRPYISAGLSGRKCWPTRSSRARKKACSPAWQTSSTASPPRRRKWGSSHPKNSSQD